MKYILMMILVGILSSCSESTAQPPVENGFTMPRKAIVLAEQASASVVILNAETNVPVWQWNPAEAGFSEEQLKWFVNPSEVKPVCGGSCVLMTASGGAVALVRIKDKEILFYGKCGEHPNPHSAEILPDGNIVAVESRYGQVCLFIRSEDSNTAKAIIAAEVPNAHNAVWSREHSCLFMTGKAEDGNLTLYRFDYDATVPALVNRKEICHLANDKGGHDLYPVYGEANKLWMTSLNGVYTVDVSDPDAPVCEKCFNILDIKSVSNSPDGIIMLKPRESWWADRLIDETGKTVSCRKPRFTRRAGGWTILSVILQNNIWEGHL